MVRRAVTLALALAALGGCALAGRTFGTYVDDKLVKGAVKLQLASDGVTRLAGVNVDTFGGTVYLTGVVQTEEQKSDAEIAAWRVSGVEQVVNDLVVRADGNGGAPSALPAGLGAHPLHERLPGVTRVGPGRPGGPDLAYDRTGRVIATVYVLGARDLIDQGLTTLRGEGRPIDHVEMFALIGRADLPSPHYVVVLWHVSELEAAALR